MKTYPLTGYMLLPPSRVADYRGVDRNPFMPTLLEGEMSEDTPVAKGISTFYRPGWRRDAYKLYEEHFAPGQEDFNPFLLSSSQVASQIQRIIQPHLGKYEIVECNIWSLELESITEGEASLAPLFLGYDIAYLNGDFYSAILNGLFINPAPTLLRQYKALLKDSGLFANSAPVVAYVRDFKQQALSEANSEFYIWMLTLIR